MLTKDEQLAIILSNYQALSLSDIHWIIQEIQTLKTAAYWQQFYHPEDTIEMVTNALEGWKAP